MKKHLVIVFLLGLMALPAFAQDEGIIINEVSNGPTGTNQEYVELLVVGCPGNGNNDDAARDTNTVNLQGWILDDNNGDFSDGPSAGEGIATGHLRFSNSTVWANVKVGSIILIYNPNDPRTADFPGDDPTDSNGDLLYVLPVDALDAGGGALLLQNLAIPNQGDNSYPPNGDASYSPATEADGWNTIGLRNDGDAIQTRRPDNSFFHGLSYGDISGNPNASLALGTNSVHIAGGSGSGIVYFMDNIPDYDYRDVANFSALTVASNESPGEVNSLTNSDLINNFRNPTFAGFDRNVCGITTQFEGNGVQANWSAANMWEFDPLGQWSLISGPGTASFTFGGIFSNSSVTVSTSGTYIFQWQQNSSSGCTDRDQVAITFVVSPDAQAGADFTVCGSSTNLNATAYPLGSWSVVSKPAGAPDPTFDDIQNENALVTVSQDGTYEFRWTIGASGCTDTDIVEVTFITTATPDAGTDQEICGFVTTLNANDDIAGTWVNTSTAVGNATFNDPTLGTTQVTVDAPGTYIFQWTLGEGTVCEVSDFVEITFVETPTADAGTNQEVCGLTSNFAGNGVVGEWQLVSSPTGAPAPTFGNNTSPTSSVSVSQAGTYQFSWSLTNQGTGVTCSNSSNVTITFYDIPNSQPGDAQEICGTTATLAATLDADTQGTWTVSPSTGVTIDDPNNPNSTVTVTDVGVGTGIVYTFTWTVESTGLNTCQDAADVSITFWEQPTADAGGPVAPQCGTTYTLGGNLATGQTGEWSVSPSNTGAGTITLDSNTTSTNPSALLSVSEAGTYTLRWTLNNGPCSDFEDVEVTFVDPQASISDVGLKQCGTSVQLAGNEPTTGETGTWTVTPAAGVSFSPNENTFNATATVPSSSPTGETYTFTWTISEGTCNDAASINISFFTPPVPEAGPDQSGICGLSTQLDGNAPATANVTGEWTYVSGPDNNPTFSASANTPNATVSVNQIGTYEFRWTLRLIDGGDVVCEESDIVQIQFVDFPDVNAGEDQPDVCGASLPASTNLSASPSPGRWYVSATSPGSAADVSFTDINNPNTSVSFSSNNTTYDLIWIVQEGTSCEISDTVSITVTPSLVASIPNNPSPVCGLSSPLEGSSTPAVSVGQWTASPATGVSFEDATNPNTTVTVPNSGDYTFTWTVGQGSCTSSDNITVSFTAPIENPDAGEDVTIYQGNDIELEASSDSPNVSYSWSPATGLSNPNIANPIANPETTTTYTVTFTDGPCVVTDEITVFVLTDLNVPNVFTPNGDMINDLWEIPALDTFDDCEIKVYNRWGNLVFESIGYDTPWDGTYNGNPVGVSVFYYTIDLKNGEPVRKGSVTVTR